MKCPKDHHAMNEVRLNEIRISVCEQCRGVWLDEGELYVLVSYFSSEKLNAHVGHWKEMHTHGKTAPRDFWKEETLVCPNDTSALKKHYFAGHSGIGIDNCPTCNGFWIDEDEMRALLEYSKPNPRDLAIEGLIRNENEFRKELAKLAMIPYTIQNVLTNPMYVGYLIFNHIAKLIVEELAEEQKSQAT